MATNDYCFDFQTWTINQEGRGRRIHWLVAILIAPLMGALFLMFLPVIGFVLLAQALARKAASVFRDLAEASAAPRAAAGEAHLTGAPGEGEGGTDELQELADEIERRRTR